MFEARVLADSLPIDEDGNQITARLLTLELTYPRCIHSELMTHRVFSRNSASSRAIPVSKMIDDVMQDPFIPMKWGKNARGMQSQEEVSETERQRCIALWLEARDSVVGTAKSLLSYGLHKQIVNRLLEPWMWITVIVSSTRWNNFFLQQCSSAAEPHMERIANMARKCFVENSPQLLREGQWHLPFVTEAEVEIHGVTACIRKSVARCARGSYLQQHGTFTLEEDSDLYSRLHEGRHWSPFEHQACCYNPKKIVGNQLSRALSQAGNFSLGWNQHRKSFLSEDGE